MSLIKNDIERRQLLFELTKLNPSANNTKCEQIKVNLNLVITCITKVSRYLYFQDL